MNFTIRSLLGLTLVVAIFVFAFTRPPQNLQEVRGLDIVRFNKTGSKTLLFNDLANGQTAHDLLSLLPELDTLFFFDADHPKLSDPGAYGTFKRVGDIYYLYFANHGWHGKWFPLTFDEAVAYLETCIEANSTKRKHSHLSSGMHLANGSSKPKRVTDDREYQAAIFVQNKIKKSKTDTP